MHLGGLRITFIIEHLGGLRISFIIEHLPSVDSLLGSILSATSKQINKIYVFNHSIVNNMKVCLKINGVFVEIA